MSCHVSYIDHPGPHTFKILYFYTLTPFISCSLAFKVEQTCFPVAAEQRIWSRAIFNFHCYEQLQLMRCRARCCSSWESQRSCFFFLSLKFSSEFIAHPSGWLTAPALARYRVHKELCKLPPQPEHLSCDLFYSRNASADLCVKTVKLCSSSVLWARVGGGREGGKEEREANSI